MPIAINCGECNSDIATSDELYCTSCFEEKDTEIGDLKKKLDDLQFEYDELEKKHEEVKDELATVQGERRG